MKVRFAVAEAGPVSGLFQAPENATACLVLAHGAGAGMTHVFMRAVADGLAARAIATLRYQFPFMEAGTKRTDRPPVAMACVRAAIAEAARIAPALTLFAGGRSFGGRMTSMAAAAGALRSVAGLVFLGFPLHHAGKPSDARAAHLANVSMPMLFVQGTRDKLADPALLCPIVAALGQRASMISLQGADHSFHVPASSGRTDAEVLEEALDGVAAWIRQRTTVRSCEQSG